MKPLRYRCTSPRGNGLPPLQRTWEGISRYNPQKRYHADARVVVVSVEGSIEVWVIDNIERLNQLLDMLVIELDCQLDAFSVLDPLPAFKE